MPKWQDVDRSKAGDLWSREDLLCMYLVSRLYRVAAETQSRVQNIQLCDRGPVWPF